MSMSFEEISKLLNAGLLDESELQKKLENMKEKEVLARHNHPIKELPSGRWQTYVDDETRPTKRREIKLSSYAKVIDILKAFYQTTSVSELRLCDIFEEWLEYKTQKKNNSIETKKQNLASYEKYVKGTKIDTMQLNAIETLALEEWAIQILKQYPMTSQVFNTHKLVVTGPLAYAKRKKYITINPWDKSELEYQHLFNSKRNKPAAERIFYPDEIEDLLVEFDRGYENNGNIANLALKLNFDLGLRVGELAALKWTDINWLNETIFIERMENASGEVVDYVKSDSEAGYRELELTEEVISILRYIKHSNKILTEFVFSDRYGKRISTIKIEHRLTKAQESLGWERARGTHCIRRTYASRLQVIGGVSIDDIRRRLGHTDLQTTLGYIYNPYRENEVAKIIKLNSILGTNKKCLQESSKNVATV